MAERYWVSGGNGNWNSTTNWSATSGGASGASVPGSSDDVFFDANGNANCLVSAAQSAKSINCSGYTSTITANAVLTVAGNVTFSSGMTVTGNSSGRITISATSSITSNGVSVGVQFAGGSGTIAITLMDDLTLTSGFLMSGTLTTMNSNTLYVSGNISMGGSNGLLGTTAIVYNGTGTYSGSGAYIKNSFTINTSGTFTITGTFVKHGTFVYIAGTVNAGTSTFLCDSTTSSNLSVSGINFYNVTLIGTVTITLSEDLNVTNTLILGGLSYLVTLNGNKITTKNLNIGGTGGNGITGTTIIEVSNGTISYSSPSTYYFRCPLRIMSASSISGTFRSSTSMTLNADLQGTLGIYENTTLSGNGNALQSLIIASAGVTVTLTTDVIITGNLQSIVATSASRAVISASSTKKLTLQQGATQDLGFTNFTNIDASDGRTIWVWKPTLTNSPNVKTLTVPKTVASVL